MPPPFFHHPKKIKPSTGATSMEQGYPDAMNPYSTVRSKFSDSVINELGKYSKTYYYDCGHKVEAFFKLNHDFDFSKTGLMRPNDKCKRGWGHKWNNYGSESKTTYGLTTTPNGDGCGACKDNCGAGGNHGMWDSWHSNGNSHGCYSRRILSVEVNPTNLKVIKKELGGADVFETIMGF